MRRSAVTCWILLLAGPLSAANVTWTGAAGDGRFGNATNWSTGTVPVLGDNVRFDNNAVLSVDLAGVAFTVGNAALSLNFLGTGNVTLADSGAGSGLVVDAKGQTAANNTLNAGGGGVYRIETSLVLRNTGGNNTSPGTFRLRTAANSTLEVTGPITAWTSFEPRTINAADRVRLTGGIAFQGNNHNLAVLNNPSGASIVFGGNITGVSGNYLNLTAGEIRLAPDAAIQASAGEIRLAGGVLLLLEEATTGNRIQSNLRVNGNATLDLGASSNPAAGTLNLAANATLTVDFSDAAGNVLGFADSSNQTWASGAILDLAGFSFAADRLRFGTNANGLTARQLSQIRQGGQTGNWTLDAGGYLQRLPGGYPNVIVILTDDHGFTDLGIHGIDTNVRTPNLDALAAGGALMRNGYSTAPQCVPSRSGLLTGRIQNTFGTRQNGDIWGRIPVPLDVPTIAERLAALGTHRTGMVGKWHLEIPSEVPAGEFPGNRTDYKAPARGFQEYWDSPISPYEANFDLAGNILDPPQSITDTRNRVIVQGEAGQAFIQRNQHQPFFLYLALYGPHWPRMSATDSYYLNFPAVDYPNYSPEMDDIRRFGLGLVWAVDDAVGGVVAKLRELGLEEKTLILFAGDNGAPPKFWDGVPGSTTIDSWTGCENLPLRGEKGSLWEGGMKVPMLAYWKGTIPAGQVIDDPVWTLDFTATTLKLAGGAIPPEFDGVDLLPRLTGNETSLTRPKPLFWDWGDEIAMRKGDWKFHRIGDRKSLFNLAEDPYELFDLQYEEPAKFAELEAELMAWYNALPADGQSPLTPGDDDLYVTGAPASNPVDPRFLIPYTAPAPARYPAPLTVVGDPFSDNDGDGKTDGQEVSAGRDPYHASDLAFEFNTGGDYEGWVPIAANLTTSAVVGGLLTGQVANGQGKFEFYDFNFDSSAVDNVLVRIRSPQATGLTFRWGTAVSDTFTANRTISRGYPANRWNTAVVPLKGHAEWDGQTITRMRLNPANTLADFEVDWLRGSTGDFDGDSIPDTVEFAEGFDAADAADARVDADGDGHARSGEYLWGTRDTDASSRPRIDSLMETGQGFTLQWNGVAGHAYKVWRTLTLAPDNWLQLHDSGTLGANATLKYTDPAAPANPRAFYRIDANLP